MTAFAQGDYKVIHAHKYVGKGTPRYRSGWELSFFRFCDENPNVLQWASEAVSIKYRNPITGKISNYIPDIFIRYVDQHQRVHTEIIEIKPRKQAMIEGKMSERDRMVVAINHAKWAAAKAWCQRAKIEFRVLTEDGLFHRGTKKR
jgi:hypothetical protein